ncbi:MAG: FAD-dependent oxidoreductase [Deltaproteobacteria bacterium]|nr:FAD-dependent oxidoreductase [Deltaproteobacteria bacterium]MBW2444370.1 FAD-dependent oxidoreductase [Deltaproteobacteria bacterium]
MVPTDPRKQKTESDFAVIGSGIGGLCCAALLARYGYSVTVCESHVTPGGAAHSFERDGFHFESGPSFFTGLSAPGSTNPIKQILDLLGEKVESVSYDRWQTHLPEGTFISSSDPKLYHEQLARFCSAEGLEQWRRMEARLERLSRGVADLPMAAMRADAGALLTLGRYARGMLRNLSGARELQNSFAWLVDQEITDPFLRRLCDFECFGLSGMDAGGTPLAEMAFMFRERFRMSVDYPIGGSQAIVAALVRGLEKHGGKLVLGAHVDSVIVEGGRARGVRLRRGGEVRARRAVVSNATIWDTLKLVPEGAFPETFRAKAAATPHTGSVVHLHLGIDATGLPPGLGIHHVVMKNWDVTAPQNVCNISIPSTLDASLAPPGHHVVHAYTAGNEPYEVWEGMHHRSEAYKAMKEERSQVLWEAMEVVIPDVRERARIALVGTPLSSERFLRRHRGTYGAAYRADQGQSFPGPKTPLPGLLCCGDSNMPGIGVPAVAVSGMVAANTLVPVRKHWKLLGELS